MIKTQEIQIKAQNLLDSLTENKFILNLDKKIADGITKLKIADTEIHKGADFTVTETIEGLDCDYLINITNSAKLTELQTILKHIIDGTQFSSVEGTISGAGTVNTDFVNMAHNIDIIIYYNTNSDNADQKLANNISIVDDEEIIAELKQQRTELKEQLNKTTEMNIGLSEQLTAQAKMFKGVAEENVTLNAQITALQGEQKQNVEANSMIQRLNEQIQNLLAQQLQWQQASANSDINSSDRYLSKLPASFDTSTEKEEQLSKSSKKAPNSITATEQNYLLDAKIDLNKSMLLVDEMSKIMQNAQIIQSQIVNAAEEVQYQVKQNVALEILENQLLANENGLFASKNILISQNVLTGGLGNSCSHHLFFTKNKSNIAIQSITLDNTTYLPGKDFEIITIDPQHEEKIGDPINYKGRETVAFDREYNNLMYNTNNFYYKILFHLAVASKIYYQCLENQQKQNFNINIKYRNIDDTGKKNNILLSQFRISEKLRELTLHQRAQDINLIINYYEKAMQTLKNQNLYIKSLAANELVVLIKALQQQLPIVVFHDTNIVISLKKDQSIKIHIIVDQEKEIYTIKKFILFNHKEHKALNQMVDGDNMIIEGRALEDVTKLYNIPFKGSNFKQVKPGDTLERLQAETGISLTKISKFNNAK